MVAARIIETGMRTAEEIDTIAHQARELLEQHHLILWRFHFNNGRKRAGSCWSIKPTPKNGGSGHRPQRGKGLRIKWN